MRHEKLSAEELVVYADWKARKNKRTLSPGAPAPGVCPDWLAGTCVLGAACPMEHKGQREPGSEVAEKAAQARAKAEAMPT